MKAETFFIFCLFFCSVKCVKLDANGTCPPLHNIKCKPGVLLPVWTPIENISIGESVARSAVYFISLMYCFLGVSIIADRFMSAIEVITSQEREVSVKTKSGEVHVISVRIWNETVSNLTLMALGSSAPEILLSIIEIVGQNFKAGDLGPGTIVGSAAFNLFIIIGLCMVVIPAGQSRRIKHLSVFFVTATWSVFAYLWLYFIIEITSPGEIQIWEAILTFLFFPVTVISAYVTDIKIFRKAFLKKKYTATAKRHAIDIEGKERIPEVDFSPEAHNLEEEYERTRLEYIETIKEIRKNHPNTDPKEIEEMAQIEVMNKCPKSRAFYRMQATRQLTGGGNVIKKSKLERKLSPESIPIQDFYGPDIQQFSFDPGHYTVMENVGTFQIVVTRRGGDLGAEVSIDYNTDDGTAVANDDYVPTSGTLVFHSNETHKEISITIIDDEIFEEDEFFNVRLTNVRVNFCKSRNLECKIVDPAVATIMVLDDDHSGVFHFNEPSVKISESCGFAELAVVRSSGARGVVRLPYKTAEGTAKGHGKDYMDTTGHVDFLNNQTEAIIRVPIVDDNEYEKQEYFFLQLGEPILLEKDDQQSFLSRIAHRGSHEIPDFFKAALTKLEHPNEEVPPSDTALGAQTPPKVPEIDTGKPRLGEISSLKIEILESSEFKNTVDRLLKEGKWSLMVGTSSWKEQFVDAITVSAESNKQGSIDGGDDDVDAAGDDDEKIPSCSDYVMHFLTVFWKVIFAFVPPTDYGGGWFCFVVSIIAIGILTAIIGDLASSFGCSVGLTDAVTATTFVALGTSLPDTFASKVAACGDKYADSSIGNVTGSNGVNVFLGIGVAWTIAAIANAVRGEIFDVPTGSLGFSVTIYCIFAVCAIVLLVLRRRPFFGGELGGNVKAKWCCSAFFIFLWVFYVILTSLENYCHIEGF